MYYTLLILQCLGILFMFYELIQISDSFTASCRCYFDKHLWLYFGNHCNR